jgi:hypothetical protein
MGSHRADVVMTSIMMQLALGARQGSKPEGGNAAFGFVEKGMVVPFTRAEGRRCEDRPETGLIHALRNARCRHSFALRGALCAFGPFRIRVA